jgi:Cu/Ag efflux protein CusF
VEGQHGTAVLTFDAAGKKIGETPIMVYTEGGYATMPHDPQYNPQAKGRRVEEPAGASARKWIKTYDAEGYLIEKVATDAEGRQLGQYVITYQRDSVGNWIKRTVSEVKSSAQPVEVSYRTISYFDDSAPVPPAEARAMANPLPASPAEIASGRALYQQKCAACHGPDGKAETAIAALIASPAGDLTRAETQNRADGELYWILGEGLKARGMPAYQPRTSENERWRLVLAVRQLARAPQAATPPPARSAPAPGAEQATERYSLKGKVISVDPQRREVHIAHEEIKGFMGAMTMPFQLKDEKLYGRLKPGDLVEATLVVDGRGWRLENVAVIK